MTEVPPDVKAAIEHIATIPDTVERDGEMAQLVGSIVLWPAAARALLTALDSQKQPDVSPDGNGEQWPFPRGAKVTKIKGIPFGSGNAEVLSCYRQGNGEWRVVVAHPEGWQHIFAPDQLEASK